MRLLGRHAGLERRSVDGARNRQKITPDRRSAWLVVAERAAHYRSRLIDLARHH
jgi:hypothetical protein